MKVLVVDDDPGSLLVAKAAVERSGHECLTAPDGDAAWRLYQSHRPCIYRYGGEEFLLLLPDQSRYGAKTVMERSLAAVKSLNITHTGDPTGALTISAGISAYAPDHRIGSAELLTEADTALYAAKTTGKNTVAVSDAK